MGVDFSASVVVGIRLSDFCEVREVETTETRYNSRTGVPYEHKDSHKVVFILGVEVPNLPLNPDEHEWDKLLGLSVFDCDDSYDKRESGSDLSLCVWGISVVGSDSHRSHDHQPLTVIQQAAIDRAIVTIQNARTALRERLGVPELIDTAPVQLFLLANVSC